MLQSRISKHEPCFPPPGEYVEKCSTFLFYVQKIKTMLADTNHLMLLLYVEKII